MIVRYLFGLFIVFEDEFFDDWFGQLDIKEGLFSLVILFFRFISSFYFRFMYLLLNAIVYLFL